MINEIEIRQALRAAFRQLLDHPVVFRDFQFGRNRPIFNLDECGREVLVENE